MTKLALLIALLVGCSSSGARPAAGGPDGGDADGGAVDATAPRADASSLEGGGTTTCFAETGASQADCKTACAPLSNCALSFGKCSDSCAFGGPSFERTMRCTAQANGDCAVFKQCIDCTAVCTQAKNCSPPQSEGDCCAGCIKTVTCEDPNALACDAIASCAAAGR